MSVCTFGASLAALGAVASSDLQIASCPHSSSMKCLNSSLADLCYSSVAGNVMSKSSA
jgi:hypothetical protein